MFTAVFRWCCTPSPQERPSHANIEAALRKVRGNVDIWHIYGAQQGDLVSNKAFYVVVWFRVEALLVILPSVHTRSLITLVLSPISPAKARPC